MVSMKPPSSPPPDPKRLLPRDPRREDMPPPDIRDVDMPPEPMPLMPSEPPIIPMPAADSIRSSAPIRAGSDRTMEGTEF